MKALIAVIATSALLVGAVGSASAQNYQHNGQSGQQNGYNSNAGNQHPGWGQDYGSNAGRHWKRGQRMGYNDWSSASAVDYHQHHLRAPPRGYEWRQSNGNYVLAAVATGVIASIIYNSGR